MLINRLFNIQGHWLAYAYYKVLAILKAESKRNVFGWLVWIIEPLLIMSVFYLVFGVLFQRGGEGFAPFLLVGIVSWLWFAGSIGRSTNSILAARQLINQVYIPKVLLPLIDIAVLSIKQVVVFFLLIILLFLLGFPVSAYWGLPIVFFTQLLLICASGMFVAAVVPFIPDIKLFVPPCLQMLMFCSGVFYSLSSLPESVRGYMQLNPVFSIIEEYRKVLLYGVAPDFTVVGLISVVSVVVILAVFLVMKKYDRYYPRRVV